jgi:hypothetical protein
MTKPPPSPFPDYEFVPNGKDLVFPDGTVEQGYELRKKTVDELVEEIATLKAERDAKYGAWLQMCAHAKQVEAERDRLRATVYDLMENMGGHQHWDAHGTHGANCPFCQRQRDASERARRALEWK